MTRLPGITETAKCLLCLALVSVIAHSTARAAETPVALGSQRHMFIDDMLVSNRQNVTFRVHPPELRTTMLRDERPWENISEYSCVIDDNRKEYKMYYGNTGKLNGVCLVTSKDGINWERPTLGIHEFDGSKENNIVIDGVSTGSVFFDPHDPDPSRRYKYFACQIADDKPDTKTTEGMVIYTSPDGIHFTKNEVVLLPFNADSQAVMFWDHYINKYVCYFRGSTEETGRIVVRGETDDPMKPWPYTPSPNPNWHNHEIPFVSTELPTVLKSDADDPSDTDIYGNQVFLYPWAYKVYLAFPTCYYHYRGDRTYMSPIGPGNVGVGEVQLAVSRDGIKWTRYRRPQYIKHGWYQEHYCYWPWAFQGMVRGDNKIYQYVRIRPTTHGGGEFMKDGKRLFMQVAIFEQQPDRFVGAEFDYKGGTLTTEPFTFQGNRLSLNVDTGGMGEGRVAFLTADGKPLPGFDTKDCDIVNGDWFDKTVSWNRGKNDVSSLAGKPVRLRFEMRGAVLYALQFIRALESAAPGGNQ
ncbi:MAG: hypothetical protein Q7T82_08205 [Armatimonadota bacterium]|nr:hypothetical protein [Armatimonadota bacterium]